MLPVVPLYALEGWPLALLLIAAVALIILLTARVELHAFLTLLVVSYLVGILGGLGPAETAGLVTDGFGSVLGYIGIVIIAGTIIGVMLERSGATIVIAETVLNAIGEERTAETMSITGGIVSIPVFCDSGFVILSGLNRALADRANLSLATLGVALAGGLYVTHVFVPPTPGPIAAAGIIGADIGLVIIAGIVAAAPIVYVAAKWGELVASRFPIDPNVEMTADDIRDQYGELPSPARSFAPLLVPIVLIALGSIAAFPEAEDPAYVTGPLQRWLLFLGDPAVALVFGAFLSVGIVPSFETEVVSDWVGDGITNAAVVLAVTGAGGSFGEVLSNLPMESFITDVFSGLGIGLLVAFLVAAGMKTAIGSSTVAIITSAGLMAPLTETFALDTQWGLVFTVLAIGAGSMTVSHANDSYFWIITEFSDMDTSTAYSAWTTGTLVFGVTGFVWVYVLYRIVELLF